MLPRDNGPSSIDNSPSSTSALGRNDPGLLAKSAPASRRRGAFCRAARADRTVSGYVLRVPLGKPVLLIMPEKQRPYGHAFGVDDDDGLPLIPLPRILQKPCSSRGSLLPSTKGSFLASADGSMESH